MKVLKRLLRLFLVFAVPLVFGVLSFKWVNSNFLLPVSTKEPRTGLVEIASGESFKAIAKKLEDQGYVKTWLSLVVLSRLKKQDTRISAGEYEFSTSMTPKEILSKLAAGEVFKRTVTINEGLSIWEIGALLEKAGIITEAEFNPALTDPKLLALAGLHANSFEGYLFPDTYNFSRPIDARKIIWTMLERGEQVWKRVGGLEAEQAGTNIFSRHEFLTLASIVEKESGNFEEQPLISSVFHNRLKQGMRLQADPTVIYGIKDFDGNLTKAHLEQDHPYNTYVNFGLPPGPICNPGAKAIESALFPADSQYLFFVADGSGAHVFSTTLREHNEAVRKYQLNR